MSARFLIAALLGVATGCELGQLSQFAERGGSNTSGTGDRSCGNSIAPRLSASLAHGELDDDCMLQWVRKGTPFALGTYAPPERDLVDVGDGHKLRRRAATAFREMQAAASRAGHPLAAVSGYRSREQQARTFERWVERHVAKSRGTLSRDEATEQVGEFSAQPGHSEHQLGTTVDVSAPGTWPFNREHAPSAFSVSCAGKWVREHAHRFGFTLSYPHGREQITCSNPEPWHLRYVGVTLAAELAERDWTLEEYFRRSHPSVAVPPTVRCPPTRTSLDYDALTPASCER